MSFVELVKEELVKARAKYDPMHSPHEAYGVILEELDEFWDEVRKQKPFASDLLEELVSVAAMAQRAAEDLGLIYESREPHGN